MGAVAELDMDLHQTDREDLPDTAEIETNAQPDKASSPAQADTDTHPKKPVVRNSQSEKKDTSSEARKKHEEKEAKRKQKWEQEQAQKKAELENELEKIQQMSLDQAEKKAVEKLNTVIKHGLNAYMGSYVSEYLQFRCYEDADLVKKILHPQKNINNCIQYISEQAKKEIERSMKDGELEISSSGFYGDAVESITVFQWAEEYFNDLDCALDKSDEEKFVPKPFRESKPAEPTKKPKNKAVTDDPNQITFEMGAE